MEGRSVKENKTIELCAACAAKRMAELLPTGLTLAKVAGGVNNKVTCWNCQRRKFGGTYEIRRAGK